MALTVTHSTVASDPQDPLLGATDWNDNHVVSGTIDPAQNNVSVDGVTITGDGTPGDPLVAVIPPDAVTSVNGQTGVVVLDTGDISSVVDSRYVTDAQLTVISNTSGTNTGDQTITLTGEATGSGTGSFAVTLANSAVIGKVLTGFSAGAGTVSATDTILQAFNKIVGNIASLVSGVSSVFGRTGDVTAQSGDYNTSQVTENTNLYFTDERAQDAIGGMVNATLSYVDATPSLGINLGNANSWSATQTFTQANTNLIQSTSSAGTVFNTNGGSPWLHGANGGSANATAYGGWNFDGATADRIAGFGPSKTLISLSTATYPSLTELSYVKGVTSAIQTQIDGKQPLDATLTALASYNTNGILTQTAADTFTGRTISGTANEITVSNGDGVLGNPTVSIPTSLTFTGKTITGGTYSSPALTTPTLGTPSSGTLTNCTGLPVSSGISGLGTGVATFLATPSSANLASAVTDETGSGSLVFSNSPTLVTPALGAASATSLSFSSTTGIIGSATNDSAAAGSVGETIKSTLAGGSAVSLTSGITSNVTSISLTAGDWDVRGQVVFLVGATTSVTAINGGINTTSATFPSLTAFPAESRVTAAYVPNASQSVSLCSYRLSLSSTTTVYLVAQGSFTISTMSAAGFIEARRMR